MGLLESFLLPSRKGAEGFADVVSNRVKHLLNSETVGNDGAEFNSKQRGLEVVNW